MASTNDFVAVMGNKISATRYLVNRDCDIGTRYAVLMSLGDRIRRARKAKKLTQVQLVAAVKRRGGDLSQPQLSAIEKDEVERPGALYEIATVLGVSAAELLGKPVPLPQPVVDVPTLDVSSIVSAGDEVVQLLDGDGAFDTEPAPPGMPDGEVTEVRGRSMLPVFRDGDRLFHSHLTEDPVRLIGEVVVAQLGDGRRFVKVLQPGKKRGTYTLESINPLYPPMPDLPVEAVAEIIWVKRRSKARR